MKLTLKANEYRDLEKLDRDELFFALAYELYIRAYKEHYKEYLSHFRAEDGKLGIVKFPKIDLYPELRTYTNKDEFKIALNELKNRYFGYMGNNGISNPYYLYIDYHFFTDEEKEICKILKEIYTPDIKSEEHLNGDKSIDYPKENKKDKFIRTDRIRKIETLNTNYEGYDIKQSYEIIYKRPKLFLLGSHKKTITQEINLSLPKHIILNQLDKIITMAKIDNEVLTDEVKMKLSYFEKEDTLPSLSENSIKEFDKKNFIKDIFCYDYFNLRFDELKKEREDNEHKRKIELQKIDNNINYTSTEKRERKSNINTIYQNKKNIETEIYEELENMDIGIKARKIKDNIKALRTLMEYDNLDNGEHFMNFIIGYSQTN